MNNNMDNLLDAYLFEVNSLIEQLDELLLNAESEGTLTQDHINEIFRSMHTIKGSSAMMDFHSLMEIAHHVEDLFFELRENGMGSLSDDQQSNLFNLLFRCVDKLRDELSKVENGEDLSTELGDFITEINSFLLSKTTESVTPAEETADSTSEDESISAPLTEGGFPQTKAPYFLHIFFDDECGMEHLRAFIVINALKEAEVNFQFYPSDVESNPNCCEYIVQHGFYIALSSDEEVEKAIEAVSTTNNIRSYEIIPNPIFLELTDPEEAPAPVIEETTAPTLEEIPKQAEAKQEVTPSPSNTEKVAAEISKQAKNLHQAAKQSLISVNLSKLDTLMALVGEIVITESMVTASPELQNIKLDGFLKSARQLRKLTGDLQDIAMSLRMVPVSGVFQKMNRIVRDMTKALNKDVRLILIGEETEVDKTIVDSIADPIMHIVRNAMDHGIEENVEDRIAAGKPAQGTIILSARHTGSEVVICIENDGERFNTAGILNKADKKGLLSKAKEEYSKKEILSLLMLPGFSTNATVTEYSGRGVGLDVVKKNVEAIGGSVTITDNDGENCKFTLKIPLTLAIVDGMEVEVGKHAFTLPISNIKQSFKAAQSDIIYDSVGNEIISCMGEFYPIIRLNRLYNIAGGYQDIEEGILIWVESNDKSFCLFVDELIGEQQVVVKPLPSYLNNFNIKETGITGCTILGDGNISIILDVGNIFTSAQQNISNDWRNHTNE